MLVPVVFALPGSTAALEKLCVAMGSRPWHTTLIFSLYLVGCYGKDFGKVRTQSGDVAPSVGRDWAEIGRGLSIWIRVLAMQSSLPRAQFWFIRHGSAMQAKMIALLYPFGTPYESEAYLSQASR